MSEQTLTERTTVLRTAQNGDGDNDWFCEVEFDGIASESGTPRRTIRIGGLTRFEAESRIDDLYKAVQDSINKADKEWTRLWSMLFE